MLDSIVKNNYDALLEYEKQKSDSVDMVSDPFGNMLKEIVKELLADKFTDNIGELSYNLGKWIYLIDALDDFDTDKKKGNFNVFNNAYPDCVDKETFLTQKKSDLEYIFGGILSAVYSAAKNVSYNFNHDLTDNILFKGIFEQTKKIMEYKKCKNTTKF